MEVYAFFIVMGMLVATIFVMIGVCIGQVHASNNQKLNKSNPGYVSGGDNNRCISDSADTDMDNSSVGNVHREVDSGCDMGYAPSTEDIIIVLDSLPYTAHLSSHETDCVRRASNIIELLKRFVDDSEE